jgi:UDP-3-O-[3-hydroxymyristoyl] glucosamine N-acyltransferase
LLTLAQLAEQLGGVWHGNANHAIFFASLSRATSRDLAYIVKFGALEKKVADAE